MRIGWYISGAAHLLFILFVLFGGVFARNTIPDVAVSDVSLISEAEYAALTPPQVAPEFEVNEPTVSAPVADQAPDAPREGAAPTVNTPQAVDVPPVPNAPDVAIPQPVPNAVVLDQPPVVTPPTDIDGSAPEPDAIAAPAPRVAPVPQVAPPPDAEIAPERVDDVAPAEDAPPDDPVEDSPPQALEEASDRIVTEAEEVETFAPASSQRPTTRPARPVLAEETPPAQDEDDTTANAIAAAVAEANERPSQPAGPPLTSGERDAFRVAVSQCWNVGSLSTEALGTTVTVGVEVAQDGVPVTASIRLVSASGGSDGAVRQAFEAARRAIIRCGARGFALPADKYDQWRDIEMTFNPEGMQFR